MSSLTKIRYTCNFLETCLLLKVRWNSNQPDHTATCIAVLPSSGWADTSLKLFNKKITDQISKVSGTILDIKGIKNKISFLLSSSSQYEVIG